MSLDFFYLSFDFYFLFRLKKISIWHWRQDFNIYFLLIVWTTNLWIFETELKQTLCFSIFLAWCFYLGFVSVMTAVRIQCRDRFDINGNAFEDFFASLFFYPNVALQLDETIKNIGKKITTKTKINMEDAENGKVNMAFDKWSKKNVHFYNVVFLF